jgi:hypothetical protein
MATISQRERTSKDGKKTTTFYQARITRAGLPPMSKAFAKRSDAEAWARGIESKIDEGQKVFPLKAARTPVSEAIADYAKSRKIAELKASDDDKQGYQEKLRIQQLAADFSDFTVGKLTWKKLEKWMETLAKTQVSQPEKRRKFHPLYNGKEPRCYSSGSIRQLYFTLKTALEWHAREAGYLLPQFLFQLDKVPAAWEKPRDRRLEPGVEHPA